MARGATAPLLRAGHRRRLLTIPALAGLGYTLSWVAGLAVPAPSPGFGATGAGIVAALSGHGPAVAAQYALTEGLPAAGIAVIAVVLARTARRHGEALAARFALVAGLAAAIISAVQFGLGLALAATSAPDPARLLFTSIDRLDGAKMLALAVLGAAAAASDAISSRYTRPEPVIATASAITGSGLVYLLLIASLAAAAGPALVLLLAFMTGCGIMIGMTADPRDH